MRNADTIAVVEKGRVAERGSYADLMAKRGAFAALVKLQQRA